MSDKGPVSAFVCRTEYLAERWMGARGWEPSCNWWHDRGVVEEHIQEMRRKYGRRMRLLKRRVEVVE